MWINVKKQGGVWKIGGIEELSKFQADWATGKPANGDCAYMSKLDG